MPRLRYAVAYLRRGKAREVRGGDKIYFFAVSAVFSVFATGATAFFSFRAVLREIALIHLVQALTLFPEASFVHCKLGLVFLLIVGLYLPRSLTKRQAKEYPFLQIAQVCAMLLILFTN